MLRDQHGREVNYMRLAVTDRCNLRCFYCMPEEGIKYMPKSELLSFEEMLRICSILGKEGVSKIRITGGEPFLRKGIMDFLQSLSQIEGIKNIPITTNGTLVSDHLETLLTYGINEMNLSLDSLDAQRFKEITRRDDFGKVMETMEEMLRLEMKVKVNMVVMEGRNIEDLIPMVALALEKGISVRFIEEMPFNGTKDQGNESYWAHQKILAHILGAFPDFRKAKDPLFSTSANYEIPGHKGGFGIIAAYSRTFCGTCNRIRLTPQGAMKTCLYDGGVFNLRDLMRAGASDNEILTAIKSALAHKALDGHEAEKASKTGFNSFESMATIGG